MYVLNSVLFQFGQILKIVLWISLPLLLVAIAITIFFHYRKKRKAKSTELMDDLPPIVLAMSGKVKPGSARKLGSASLRDGFGLLQYGKQLEESRTKYDRLQQEFTQLKLDYELLLSDKLENADEKARDMVSDLKKRLKAQELKSAQLEQALEFARNNPDEEISKGFLKQLDEKEEELHRMHDMIESLNRESYLKQQMHDSQAAEINKMEQLLKELQASAQLASTESRSIESNWHQNLEELNKQHFEEKSKYEDQWKEMQEAYRKLQEESLSLQEQLLQQHANAPATLSGEELALLQTKVEQLEEEKDRLKKELGEYHSLQDIAEEKKLQIDFVQQQLDQRIRQYHELEWQYKELQRNMDSILQSRDQLVNDCNSLKGELEASRLERRNLQEQLLQKEGEWDEIQKTIQAANERYSLLEEENRKLGDQFESMESSTAADRELILQLRQSLAEEQERATLLEKKLYRNIDLLKQMYEAVIVSAETGQAGSSRDEVFRPAMHEAGVV